MWQGELSTLERAQITTNGTAKSSCSTRCRTGQLCHPSGVFPFHGTGTEAHSQETFKAYRDFKKHAAEDVSKESNKAKHLESKAAALRFGLEVRPVKIDWQDDAGAAARTAVAAARTAVAAARTAVAAAKASGDADALAAAQKTLGEAETKAHEAQRPHVEQMSNGVVYSKHWLRFRA